MTKKIKLMGLPLITLTTILLSSCGESTDGATAKLAFQNATSNINAALRVLQLQSPINPMSTAAPTEFKIKLITAYLAQDISEAQNNVGGTSFIYLNPDCEEDISHCDISGGNAEDGSAMDKIVSTYFDFAQNSADVNTALNAQGRSVEVATYKYVRLEFCKYNNEDASNVKWQADGMAAEVEFQRNMCTVTSQEMDPPLEVLKGDSITVNLTYDISAAINIGTTGDNTFGDNCSEVGAVKYCFTIPTFVPSATK